MIPISLSGIQSSSGSSLFTGNITWVEEGGLVTVYLRTWITAGYTYATIDGTLTVNGSTLATGQWGTIYSSQLSAGDIAVVCSGSFPLDPGSAVTVEGYATIRNSGSFSGTISGSGTIALESGEPDIGPSPITLGAASVQPGDDLLILLTPEKPQCSHDLFYTFGGNTQLMAENVGSSYIWKVPDLTAQLLNTGSGSCTITCQTHYAAYYIGETAATVTLLPPEASLPSLESGEATLGLPCTINCRRNSPHFSVKLELDFQGTTVTIGEGAEDSFFFTPSYDLAKQIPTLTQATGTLRCTTFLGTAQVGAKTCTIRLKVPDNETTRPRFREDDLVLSPVSTLGPDFSGCYIRGKTGLKAAFSGEAPYSRIVSWELTAGMQTAAGNPAVIGLLTGEGAVKITAKVTDARGYSAIQTKTITILPYSSPRIIPYTGYSSVICERARENGSLDPGGTWLAIRAGRSFTSLVLEGQEKNRCLLRYRWKPSGAGEYGSWITLLEETDQQNQASLLVANVVSSLQHSYQVELEVLDTLGGSHRLTFQIMTEAVSFVLCDGPDGAAFGKYPEAPHVVDIASHMTLLVRGGLQVLGDAWTGLDLAEGMTESGHSCGRKEPGCFYLVTEGRQVHIAFNCAFSYAGTCRVVNAQPIPAQFRPARTVFSACICNDRMLACVSADPDGYIRVEWVLTPGTGVASAEVTWTDGYLSYWIN